MSTRTKIWLSINMALILGAAIFYAIESSVISIAAVVSKFYADHTLDVKYINELNHTFNIQILIDLGMFSILELLSYIGYLIKSKRLSYSLLFLEGLLAVLAIEQIITTKNIMTSIIWFIPLISNVIYLRICNDEKPKKRKK